MVPEGFDVLEAASRVRTGRRRVTVPRDKRAAMVEQILTYGWRAAYNINIQGDDLVVISGWEWQHPKLPGSPVTPPASLIEDVCLLKEWKSRGDTSQEKRATTLMLTRLNKVVIKLGVWGDSPEIQLPRSTERPAFGLGLLSRFSKKPPVEHLFEEPRLRDYPKVKAPAGTGQLRISVLKCRVDPAPKNDMRDFHHDSHHARRGQRGLGNAWGTVGDDWKIARPRRYEEYRCRHIARHLGVNSETERLRVEDLNLQHEAWLESITGKTIEFEDYTGDGHAVSDPEAQTAAIDMTFEHVGYKIEDRRARKNEFLEDTEKTLTKGKRKGKTYRPNRADPGKVLIKRGAVLDGWASWHALFDASRGVRVEGWEGCPKLFGSPPKKGSDYFNKLKPTAPKERGLFGSSRTAPIEVYTSDYKAEQELQDTQDFDLSARRSRRQRKRDVREIDMSEDWAFGSGVHSYADELMTFAAKKPIPHECGVIPLGYRVYYSERTVLNPALYDGSPFSGGNRIPYHDDYAIE